ncbi:MAG TPA: SgcJ/EcaC family oxidoreductase [Candidatus Acidoferrum sp.]|nr:SgcJ/EcaC family oxidoreductase [Candidatus Acidoferrum sp.]
MDFFFKVRPVLFTALALLFASSCAQPPQKPAAPPDTRAADEAAIRALDADWQKAVTAKDAAQAASYYAENASLFVPESALVTGKDAIQKTWTDLVKTPGFSLTFTPSSVTVSKSGDLAYEIGDYQMTMNDKRGKPRTDNGKYVVVWGRQADGSWKVLADVPTTVQ